MNEPRNIDKELLHLGIALAIAALLMIVGLIGGVGL